MKTILYLLVITFSFHLYAGPIESLLEVLDVGTHEGRTDDGGRCSVEINKIGTSKIRVYLTNPRIFQFEFDDQASVEATSQVLRISGPTIYEDNAEITTTLVVDGKSVGFERKFCTYKCWVSIRPCLLY